MKKQENGQNVNFENNKNEVEDINKGIEKETIDYKVFKTDIFNINYINTSKIFLNRQTDNLKLKINNYLCSQEGNNLNKVTEIIYKDKLIRIEDKFQVNVDIEKLKPILDDRALGRHSEKIRIFANQKNQKRKKNKKDKKNIVKNIVKIFLGWLERKDQLHDGSENPLYDLKRLMSTQNFNNRLIKKISTKQGLNKLFLQFLENDGEDEIKYSRIKDKQSHYEAIPLYINLIKKIGNENEQENQDESSSSYSSKVEVQIRKSESSYQ